MRVAHIANMYGPNSGGLRTTVDQLTLQYQRLGAEVLVITPGTRDSESVTGTRKRIEIAAPILPFSGGYRVITKLNRVRKILSEFAPEVLEISDRTTLLLLAPWARRNGIRVTVFAHERLEMVIANFLPRLPFRATLIRKWNQWTASHVDQVVATTQFAALEFQPWKKAVVIPLGVDHHQFKRQERVDVKGHLEKFGISKTPYLIACTRLSPEKDPVFLLEVAREMKARAIDHPIVIAGAGPVESYLRREIQSEDLQIHLIGFVKNKDSLARLMSHAAVFLAPGPIETFGLAALESLATGTPVIARSSAAISEVIDAESGSTLPRNATEWVDEISKFLSMDREFVARKCVERASIFNWEVTVLSLLRSHDGDASTPRVVSA